MRLLTTTPPFENPVFTNQALKKLIIPLIIEQILVLTVGMADTMMISSCGEAAVSGVSLVDMINVVIINIFSALATGGAVVASQFIGAQKQKQACESAGQLVIVTVALALLVMAATIILRKPLLDLFFGSIAADVMDNALIYLVISAISYPFIALYNACAALFRSMGNSRISMLTSLLMNVINICGNAILIFVFQMGVAGAAIATLFSRMIAAFVMFFLLTSERHIIHLDLKRGLHLNFALIGRILKIGVPNGLENSFFQLGRVLVVSIIAGFGTVQIAANAVANNIDSLGCIPGQALSLAMITVVGQCVGAADYKQTVYYRRKILAVAYLATFVLNSLLLICLPWILSVYNLSEETLSLAMVLIFIHNATAMLLWPASFVLPNALRAANDVTFTMVISVFSMIVFRILFSYILGIGYGLGAVGVWIAMVLDWIFRAALFIWRTISGKWRTKAGL